jgi:putative transcription factor
MDNQQYFDEIVVLRKQANSKADKAKEMRSGNYETKSKNNNELLSKNYKLDNETEELKHTKIAFNLSKTIQQARADKKMTQKQLAQAINKSTAIIAQYENGSALPDNQILGKLERSLGVKLRGKKI